MNNEQQLADALRRIIDAHARYGWSTEVDTAIYAGSDLLAAHEAALREIECPPDPDAVDRALAAEAAQPVVRMTTGLRALREMPWTMELAYQEGFGDSMNFADYQEAWALSVTKKKAAQPAAQPVAWGMRNKTTGLILDVICPDEHEGHAGEYTIPLYAAPQPKAEAAPGLLMSMAIRYDHALALPGYYDSALFAGSGITHAQRLEGTLRTMAQLWEEVTGNGFYRPEREAEYAAIAAATKEAP